MPYEGPMPLDDAQQWKQSCRTVAQMVVIYQEALKEAGVEQDSVHELTVSFGHMSMESAFRPDPTAWMNDFLEMMKPKTDDD